MADIYLTKYVLAIVSRPSSD